MSQDPGGTNQSVERAAAVLRAFTQGRPSLRVSDVARASSLGVSTASRLLSTLEALDLVERDEASSLYRLGPGVLELAGVALNQHPVHRESRQVAQSLACEYGLGANIAVRYGAALFYLANFEGRLAPKAYSLMGQTKPLHATALGKCLLVDVTPANRRELLGPELVAFTNHTVTDHGRLDDEVELVARRGYSTEVEELALGRACVGAPVRDATGRVVAALSLSGPLSAMDLAHREDALGRVVIEGADAISTGLGMMAPPQLAEGRVR